MSIKTSIKLCIFLFCILYGFLFLRRMVGLTNVSDNQFLGEDKCIVFLRDGSLEYSRIMYTFFCDKEDNSWKNIEWHSNWEKLNKKIIDEHITLHCPKISLSRLNNENFLLKIREDTVCTMFNICSEDPESRHCGWGEKDYMINQEGKFIEL